MRRRAAHDQELEGSDSFLDIVANIVGILIILVMVVGVRVKHAPLLSVRPAASEEPQPQAPDLSKDREAVETRRRELTAFEQEAIDKIRQNQKLALQIRSRRMQRERFSTSVAAIDHQLKEKRNQLGDTQRAELELKDKLAKSQAQLDDLDQQRALAAGMEPTSEKLTSITTPISRTVFGKEEHFRLSGGRIAYIPLDRLIVATKSAAQTQVWKLNGVPEISDTVAPIEGFALRYTLGRVPIDGRGGAVGAIIGFTRWEIVPTGGGLGESIDEALAPNSRLRAVLARGKPKQTTITLWTYPDSFEIYRTLKTELFKLGFSTAGRPLPEGVAIAGSPGGSKSAAQ